MKIRTIKKKMKLAIEKKYKLTPMEAKWFSKAPKYNKSIRNTCILGSIRNGNYMFAFHLEQLGDKNLMPNWKFYNY